MKIPIVYDVANPVPIVVEGNQGKVLFFIYLFIFALSQINNFLACLYALLFVYLELTAHTA